MGEARRRKEQDKDYATTASHAAWLVKCSEAKSDVSKSRTGESSRLSARSVRGSFFRKGYPRSSVSK